MKNDTLTNQEEIDKNIEANLIKVASLKKSINVFFMKMQYCFIMKTENVEL